MIRRKLNIDFLKRINRVCSRNIREHQTVINEKKNLNSDDELKFQFELHCPKNILKVNTFFLNVLIS